MSDGHLELVWSRVRGGPRGALLALLDAAEEDPRAAEGLMAAYSAMGDQERARLVETIISDGRAAGRPVSGTLALLLGAEPDPDLARAIAAGLDQTVARPENDRGWLWGDPEAGGVLVVRHLHGVFVEALAVRWQGMVLDAEGEALLRFDEPSLCQRFGLPAGADPVPLEHAVDRMVDVVWRARRHGEELPSALRSFAHVFTVRSPVAVVDGPPPDGVE